MKKLLTFAFTALLGVSLAFAQATGGSGDKSSETGKKRTTESGKKATKTKQGKDPKQHRRSSTGKKPEEAK